MTESWTTPNSNANAAEAENTAIATRPASSGSGRRRRQSGNWRAVVTAASCGNGSYGTDRGLEATMRRVSKKRAKRNADVQACRLALKFRVDRCECCGYVPWLHHNSRRLDVHEIARGPNRDKALDQPYACLCVCSVCHDGPIASRAQWPEARQLAALKRSRPADYDLAAYNALVGRGPQRVTEEDVAKWL